MITFKKLICCLTVLSFMVSTFPVCLAKTEDENIAYADFDKSELNMLSVKMGSGEANVVERGGRKGWELSGAGGDMPSSGIYIELEDSFAGDLEDGNVFDVEIDYFDEGSSLFSLLYNSWDKDLYFAGTIFAESLGAFGKKANLNQWKTASFRIQDGKFKGNKVNPDIIVAACASNRNTLQEGQINEFGQAYSNYYFNTYAKTTSEDPIVIGAVRVKKAEKKNPFDVKIKYDFNNYTIFDDEPIKLSYNIKNVQNRAYTVNAKYELIDNRDRVVKAAEETYDIASGESKDIIFDFGQTDSYGELKFKATFTGDGAENITQMPLCHCREAKEANKRLGANVHFEGANRYPQDFDGEYELIKRGGYSSCRDSLRWGDLTSSGVSELTPMLKKEMEYQKKYGLDLLGIADIDQNVTGDQSSPATLEKFKKHCAWLAKEYKGLCNYFEADNEWNLHMDSTTEKKDYINLLKATYEGLKQGDPNAKLMGVDWGGFIPKDFRTICETGCLDYMDAFSYHVYFSTRGPADAGTFTQGESVRELLKEFGHGDMPLFLTENGWTDCFSQAITLEDEAQWHAQLILQNSAWKTFEMIYPYEFANSGEEKNYQEACFGVVESPYSTYPSKPKLSYITTAMANWALGGTEFEEALDGMSAGSELYAYKYKRKNDDGLGNNMIALWTTNDREQLGLDLGTDSCKMYDMYGNECELKATNGVFTFALSYRPIYLIGNFDKISKAAPQFEVTSLTLSGATGDTVIQNIRADGAENAKIVPYDERIFKTAEHSDIKDGKSRFVIETPAQSLFNTRCEYDIVKDEKVLYHGDMRINGADTVSVNVTHKMVDTKSPNRWRLEITVTNNRNSSNVSGSLKIKNPQKFGSLMSGTFTDLAPQETKIFKFYMPEIVSKEMLLFDMDVNLSNGETLGCTKRLFFTVVPYADKKPVVDGIAEVGEYNSDTWFDIKAGNPTGQYTKQMYESLYNSGKMHLGEGDLSAKATMKYDEKNIWFFIDVTDDIFVNNNTDSMIWNGDSIQIGITDESITRGGKYCELTVALTPEGPQMYRHMTNNNDNPIGPVTNCDLAIVRDANHIKYEIRLPWSEVLIDSSNVKAGNKPKFAFLINEDDGLGRNSYMEYSQSLGAIGTYKDVSLFSDMILAK